MKTIYYSDLQFDPEFDGVNMKFLRKQILSKIFSGVFTIL